MSDRNLHRTLMLSEVTEETHNKIIDAVEENFGITAYHFYVADWSNNLFIPVCTPKYTKYNAYYSRDLDKLRVEVYDTVDNTVRKIGVLIIQTGEGFHSKTFKVLEVIKADFEKNLEFAGYSYLHEEVRWGLFDCHRPFVVIPNEVA